MDNWLDIVLLIFIFLGGIRGYRKGLIDQLSGLTAILIAIFLSMKFSSLLSEFIVEKDLIPEQFVGISSLIITFLLVFLAIKWSADLVEKVMKSVGINFLNRVAGAVVGILINALILCVIVYFAYPYLNNYNIELVKTSAILPQLNEIAQSIAEVIL